MMKRVSLSALILAATTIGSVIHLAAADKPGPAAVAGGMHATRLADEAADAVRAQAPRHGKTVHVFAAAPNSFMFYFGQHCHAMGRVILYEFDFGGTAGGYRPAHTIG